MSLWSENVSVKAQHKQQYYRFEFYKIKCFHFLKKHVHNYIFLICYFNKAVNAFVLNALNIRYLGMFNAFKTNETIFSWFSPHNKEASNV
jgi:hypothetical protein